MDTNTQHQDFQYFISNHDEICSLYPNKFVVIQDKQVVLVEDTFDKALQGAIAKGLELGTFIVQECSEGEEAYTQNFYTRAIFD